MRKVSAVIGSNFGDEGKGLATDYLCSNKKSLVVRFNGGSQAGHTVVTPHGVRHVFQHFGSGSFGGAHTFLSKHFIANPISYRKERSCLNTIGLGHKVVLLDPRCILTTPYDIMLNQAAEQARAKKLNGKHGSCGMGINETVIRSNHDHFKITAENLDIGRKGDRNRTLRAIQKEYLPQRAKELSDIIGEELTLPFAEDETVFGRFLEDINYMYHFSKNILWEDLDWKDDIVFEGAQGLMLDMDNQENFPHVTRSKTGISNVLSLLGEKNFFDNSDNELEAFYITRCYLTRHGAGPMRGELPGIPYIGVKDKTNITNDHQGRLRFALLDVHDTTSEMRKDFGKAWGLNCEMNVFITCLDQVGEDVKYTYGGRDVRSAKIPEFIQLMREESRSHDIYGSFGPSRTTVEKYPSFCFGKEPITYVGDK